ncbi:2-polyprenyl-3-methyl-5-hydroxy-6-metoxy-1,4-benzoquinol methylase [Xanthomonas campestris]|uniref:class I SAM-dependent methyltransferase n=1 Tax=Xanthomonas sp. CFBP 8151 TaxID=3035310 RepID=UPI00141B90B5|nr:class I SAM-dependent methyltransferase [Xanthomonas sp. CFBP 8151]NIJ77537.1 2-polyprenyl-3-methyl-5-hydroxy-6-metoxy-1,4-benzoquinol methylase [Xanthomonas sp. CFBP 8151]
MIYLRKNKSLSRITREWDAIANLREQQIASGRDHSANFVLAPAILESLPRSSSLVDIGCGTGWLTSRAAPRSKLAVGVDPSPESIAIAQTLHAGASISYRAETVEQYARRRTRPQFDTAISNMAASSAPDLQQFFSASRRLLRKGGQLIATFPHPCFWPLYWGYASHPKFRYGSSFAVEGQFKIRNQSTQMVTTHFHHPLELYFSTLTRAGFEVETVRELSGRGFKLPRFMLVSSHAV